MNEFDRCIRNCRELLGELPTTEASPADISASVELLSAAVAELGRALTIAAAERRITRRIERAAGRRAADAVNAFTDARTNADGCGYVAEPGTDSAAFTTAAAVLGKPISGPEF